MKASPSKLSASKSSSKSNLKSKPKNSAKSKATNGTSKIKDKKKSAPKWPGERQILWRPQRFAYLQGKNQVTDCVFCDANGMGVKSESLVVYDNGTSMLMLNKFPYNNGHLLVLPNRHVGDFDQLSDEEYVDLQNLVRRAVTALRQAYDKTPPGMNVGLNLGSAAGAGIPQHLHYHIIPRWIGDANFFPLVGQTKVISETLEQTYTRLLPYFK
jgi:ATP adenylyltransferase